MRTSERIKQGQYRPASGTRKGDRWTFASESRKRVSYQVSREGRAYKCGCPARGLCRHITSAVLDDARLKWKTVQVWTSQEDAARQHRRTVKFTANGRLFWVTFAGKVDPVADLDAEIRDLGEKLAEARHRWYMVGGGQVKADARAEVARLREQLMDRQVARERAVAERKAA